MQEFIKNKNSNFSLSSQPTNETKRLSLDEEEKLNEEEENEPKNTLLSWQAKDFEKVERHRNWYLIVFIFIIAMIAYALFTDNLLMAVLFILFGTVIYLFEKKDPQLFNFGISPEGVIAHNKLYEFASLESFWIFYEPLGKKVLSLKSKKKFLPFVQVPLENVNPAEIRNTLLKFIPEVRQEEGLLDILERFF